MHYRDQHDITSTDAARILSRNALVYQDYLYQVLGRDFVLALPVEVEGPMQLHARFVSDEKSSGEKYAPAIDLWIEFNPAMGLYTVWGEYFRKDGDEKPVYTSSPHSGFDDELLGDPSRLFDWLKHVAKGEPVSYDSQFMGMMTPAGAVEGVVTEQADSVLVLRLEPEYRMPLDYYVSGTGFPGAKGGEMGPIAAKLGRIEWENYYANPVRDAVQRSVDNLYGEGTYEVDVDEEGYVYVTGLQPIPAQNFGSLSQPKGASTMSYPKDSNLGTMESKGSWYANEMLRMAGVKGDRLNDRRLDEKYTGGALLIDPDKKKKKKKEPPASFPVMVKDVKNQAAYDALVAKLKERKAAGEKGIEDPERLANWIFLQNAGRKSRGGKSATEEAVAEARKPKTKKGEKPEEGGFIGAMNTIKKKAKGFTATLKQLRADAEERARAATAAGAAAESEAPEVTPVPGEKKYKVGGKMGVWRSTPSGSHIFIADDGSVGPKSSKAAKAVSAESVTDDMMDLVKRLESKRSR